MARSAAPDTSAVVDRFDAELHARLTETLDSVCSSFRQELQQAARPREPSVEDYETYYACCKRLVDYVAANLDTSPGFVQMMERIILACHSDASARVVSSVVTKDVWLRPQGKQGPIEGVPSKENTQHRKQKSVREMTVEAAATAPPIVKAENELAIATPTEVLLLKKSPSAQKPVVLKKLAKAKMSALVTPLIAETRSSATVASERGVVVGVVTPISTKPARKRLKTSGAKPMARKRPRTEEIPISTVDGSVIQLTSSEEEKQEEPDKGSVDLDALFGLSDGDMETEQDGVSEKQSTDAYGSGEQEDDDDEAEWIEGESDDSDDSGSESDDNEDKYANREPPIDTIGKLCYPERRTPQQTRVFRERVSKALRFVDAMLCRPPPGKRCSRNCQQIRAQRCLDVFPCRHELCQLWHEADAHMNCCRNNHCECKTQVMLHETIHIIEHQHAHIKVVHEDLVQRRAELQDAKALRPRNPVLERQVTLLEQELQAEQDQLEFYHHIKRVNTQCAAEAGVDTTRIFNDFAAHYIQIEQDHSPNQMRVEPDGLLSYEDSIKKLCYGAQRTQDETVFFKERLRKTIKFVDALLCKPPRGQVCTRGCKRIQAQHCKLDVPCDNQMCRVWHDAEAHIDNCSNPQCEFRIRVVLRETMHAIEEKRLGFNSERTKLHRKKSRLAFLKNGLPSDQESTADGSDDEDPVHREKRIESALLKDEIQQLEQNLEEEKKALSVLTDKETGFWASLHTIGVDKDDDVADGFPDFARHYQRPSKK